MFKILGSSHPKYLAATDLLVGDMSNINYEFLLLKKPIILLANNWVKNNFPNIGPKPTLGNLEETIYNVLNNPNEYKSKREFWLKKTIEITKRSATKKYIDLILKKSQMINPKFIFVTGGNSVRETNISPLAYEVKKRLYRFSVVKHIRRKEIRKEIDTIIIGAHFRDIPRSKHGYKVHIDHDLKGIASANLNYAIWDYKRNNYFPNIDLHIVAGKAGELRTRKVLGPLADRTQIAGYPKGDEILNLNTRENKFNVFKELEFDMKLPLVTYAPAGYKSYMKPGGSLDKNVIKKFEEISKENKCNILLKMK